MCEAGQNPHSPTETCKASRKDRVKVFLNVRKKLL